VTKRCYAGCQGECRCYPPEEPPEATEFGHPLKERHAWDDLKEELRGKS
jgi:hypothetical protein